MNRLFRDILRENKNDYIRTVLGCSWIISLIYFSTAVGGCLSYISTGSIPQMTYLIMEVEKEFLIPYGLLLILLILLLSGYIRKRAVIYKTLTVFGMKRKHKYRFILFEYLGIVGFSMILGIVLGIYESKGLKIILEYFFANIKGHNGTYTPVIFSIRSGVQKPFGRSGFLAQSFWKAALASSFDFWNGIYCL